MFLVNTKRIFISGFRSFVRSGFTSFANILMMTITIFFLLSLIFGQATLSSLNTLKEKFDVTAYFLPTASEASILEVSQALKKLPEVKEVIYTSASQALADFKERHSSDYLTLQALDELGDNPLGATLAIKAYDPAQYESIAKYFENNSSISDGNASIIDKVDYNQNKDIIYRLIFILTSAQKLGTAVSLILILISIIITFSTMRLIIYMSREEIAVMRLVGAGQKYIGGPFLVTGMIVGIISAVSAMIIFLPISIWLGNQMTGFIGINLFDYYKSNFFQLLALSLLSGIILGSVSSVFAIVRYLRK